MVRSTDRPAMTIAVDLGRKATKQTKNTESLAWSMAKFDLHGALHYACKSCTHMQDVNFFQAVFTQIVTANSQPSAE